MSDKNHSILIVDDDTELHQQLRFAFRRNYEFDGAINAEQLRKKLASKSDYSLILMDLVLDSNSNEKVGLDLIMEVSTQYPHIPIIVVTADKEVNTVVDAMHFGASDFLTKGSYDYDLWNEKFLKVIESKQLKIENQELKKEVKRHREKKREEFLFIGESPAILEIKRILKIVANEPEITVLITGETGVGKEVAARYLHYNGERADQPFEGINLSAIQDTLLESTLFGHKKGAFTGALKDVEGIFHQANKGVLLLDEIGDINPAIQIKLLRFLETKMIRPVGAEKDIKLDIQIIAATHKDIAKEVSLGNFREDLYQRLKAMIIEIPPLRERKEDIILILNHYLKGDAHELITPEAIRLLVNYQWVGNIRELKNTVNYMLLRKKILDKSIMDEACLPAEIINATPTGLAQSAESTPKITRMDANSIEEEHAILDLKKIEAALIKWNKVKKDVAVDLGLENTDNLRYKIRKYYGKHPHLFASFPTISKSYRRIVKTVD